MSESIAALIGALGAILGPVAGALIGLRSRAQRKEAERQLEGLKGSLREHVQPDGGRYAYRCKRIQKRVTITNLDGDATVERRWIGLRASSDASVQRIPGRFWVMPGRLKGNPRLADRDDFAKLVKLVTTKQNDHELEYFVQIEGELRNSDGPLSFSVCAEYVGGFHMTAEDVEAGYQDDVFRHEFISQLVECPADELELEIRFPEGYSARTFAVAFFGLAEVVDPRESTRIVENTSQDPPVGISSTDYGARLLVRNPVIAYRYAIYWESPSASVVKRLRRS